MAQKDNLASPGKKSLLAVWAVTVKLPFASYVKVKKSQATHHLGDSAFVGVLFFWEKAL